MKTSASSIPHTTQQQGGAKGIGWGAQGGRGESFSTFKWTAERKKRNWFRKETQSHGEFDTATLFFYPPPVFLPPIFSDNSWKTPMDFQKKLMERLNGSKRGGGIREKPRAVCAEKRAVT
jgi:hypothetical protein